MDIKYFSTYLLVTCLLHSMFPIRQPYIKYCVVIRRMYLNQVETTFVYQPWVMNIKVGPITGYLISSPLGNVSHF